MQSKVPTNLKLVKNASYCYLNNAEALDQANRDHDNDANKHRYVISVNIL